jgi:hypothetical protein
MLPCSKWGKSAAGTFRCHAAGGKCNEESKQCPLKKQTKLVVEE